MKKSSLYPITSFLTLLKVLLIGIVFSLNYIFSETGVFGLFVFLEEDGMRKMGDSTGYYFFLLSIVVSSSYIKKFRLNGLTNKTIFYSEVLSLLITIAIYIGGFILLMVMKDFSYSIEVISYYLASIFFNSIIFYMFGSIIYLAFQTSKASVVSLIMPLLVGTFFQLYFWINAYAIFDPSINGGPLNLTSNSIGSLLIIFFTWIVWYQLQNNLKLKV